MGVIGYVGADTSEGNLRRRGLPIALAFFAGITLGLTILGTAAAVFGKLLVRWSWAFAMAVGALSIVVGILALFGPALRKRFANPSVAKGAGVSGAFAYGLLFTVATLTTSAGPLMLLLTITAAVGQPAYGALLSLGYGIGRGLPFLLLGLFAGQATTLFERLGRARRMIEVASGVALIAVGMYFAILARQMA